MADVGSSLLVEGYDPEDHVEKWPAVGRGFLTVWNDTHKVERSGRYWTFAYYSRHVRRGARVFQTDTLGDSAARASNSKVSHMGFRNPDGSNTGELLRQSGEGLFPCSCTYPGHRHADDNLRVLVHCDQHAQSPAVHRCGQWDSVPMYSCHLGRAQLAAEPAARHGVRRPAHLLTRSRLTGWRLSLPAPPYPGGGPMDLRFSSHG